MTLRVLVLAALLLSLACTHELEGAPCACAEGFTCCVAEDVCVAGMEHCLADLACGGAHAPLCGAHAQCVDGPHGGACTCDEGYAGPDCTACSEGFSASAGSCVPMTVLPSCERDGGCEECAALVYCDTPSEVARDRGTWCRQRACTRDEALADCVDNIVPRCGGATSEPFFMEFEE